MASTPININPTPNPITQNASGAKTSNPATTPAPVETPKTTVPSGLEQDTVNLNTSHSTATDASKTAGEATANTKTKAAGKAGQSTTEQAAQDTAKASRPFYQPIIDFFQKMGQKIMDIFTPTSKEALEKAVLKAEHKAGVYQERLSFNQQTLEREGLSDIQKELLEKDSQKVKDKLARLETQYTKLTGKLEKLGEATATQATTKAAAEATTSATGEAAEATSKAASKSTQQSTSEGLEKAAQETTDALDTEKAAKEFMEGLSRQLDEISAQIKEKAPQYVDEFTNLLKKFLR